MKMIFLLERKFFSSIMLLSMEPEVVETNIKRGRISRKNKGLWANLSSKLDVGRLQSVKTRVTPTRWVCRGRS